MFYLKKYYYFIIIVIIIILFLISLIPSDEQTEIVEQVSIEKETIQESNNETIKIDIKGAVNNPGVYELAQNSRVIDAIAISGGLTKEADTSLINLSKNLLDEMVLIIYTVDEINEMREGNTSVKYIEKECICPKIENDACIENIIDNNPNNIVDNNPNNVVDNNPNTENDKISLNNATLDELMTLDGIGEVKAKAIIAYREENGGFKKIEDLMEVNGIGEATFNKIKEKLVL